MNKALNQVLVTGASGLLGRALVQQLTGDGLTVLAHYHSHPPPLPETDHCHWIRGDFSTLEGIGEFLERCRPELDDCGDCVYLVNNYGPITVKPTTDVGADDFYRDFHHNVVTALEITRFLLARGGLRAVVNVGFEFVGEDRGFRTILPYAAAKNTLLLLTRSLADRYPETGFHMVSPPTLEGAAVPLKGGRRTTPQAVAREIARLLFMKNDKVEKIT